MLRSRVSATLAFPGNCLTCVQSEAEALTQVGFRALCAASPHPVTHDRVKCSGDTTNDSLVHNVEVGSDSLDPPMQPILLALPSNLGSQIPESKSQSQGLTSPRPPDPSSENAYRAHNLVHVQVGSDCSSGSASVNKQYACTTALHPV